MSFVATAIVCGFMGLGSPNFTYIDEQKNCARLESREVATEEICMGPVLIDLGNFLAERYPGVFPGLTLVNYTCAPPDLDSDL